MRRFGLLLAMMGFATPALAGDPPSPPITDAHRLSEAEVAAILDQAEARRQAAPAPLPRQVEGEIGVGIGTGGYREAFGTAVIPLGQSGTAIISFDSVESNRGVWRRR